MEQNAQIILFHFSNKIVNANFIHFILRTKWLTKITCFVIVNFVVSFDIYMIVFVSIVDDEKAEKTQPNPTSPSWPHLVSSFAQPLSSSFPQPYFSLIANPTFPLCRCCKWFNPTLLSRSFLVYSRYFQRGYLSSFSFFFIFCYLESYMCSYTLFYNFQLPVFLLLISKFHLAFCFFVFLY
jgi:hypothetical protein